MMRMLLAVIGGMGWLLAGCQPPSPPQPPASYGAYPVRPSRYEAQAPIADSRSVHDLVESCRGNIVLLAFWTRYMDTPRRELRELAELQRAYYARGLRVIACNTDDPADWNHLTRPLLLSAGANYTCVIVRDGSREPLRTWLKPDWSYAMPACFLFDRQGQLVNAYIERQATMPVMGQAVAVVLGVSPIAQSIDAGVRAPRQPTAPSAAVRMPVMFIDVALGAVTPLSRRISVDDPESIDAVAEDVVRRLSPRSQRVGVLRPADSAHDAMAERLVRSVRLAGAEAVETPDSCARWLEQINTSEADILADPTVVQGRWDLDYLLFIGDRPAR